MKVELLVNLKTVSGKIVSKGTIFSDENSTIPDFIMNRIERGMARIISVNSPPTSENTPERKKISSKEEKIPEKVGKEKKTNLLKKRLKIASFR